MESSLLGAVISRGLLLSLCLVGWEASAAPLIATPPAAGITIISQPLGLEFASPEGWRLAKESTAEELMLYGHAKKVTPLMRIRIFAGRLSPADRISEMKRGLPKGEGQVVLKSKSKWKQNGHRFETARAMVKVGSAEYTAIFTLIDHPKKIQHGFWLYGRTKDVEKQWPLIQASIASARSTLATTELESSAEQKPLVKKVKAPAVWTDPETSLAFGRWPAGFSLDPKTEDKLFGDGMRLISSDSRAHAKTAFLVRACRGAKPKAYLAESDALKQQLEGDSNNSALRQVSLRVAGISSSMLQWKQAGKGGSLTHESYFIQSGPTVFRIDFTAADSWARSRSRRNLVKDFIGDIRL